MWFLMTSVLITEFVQKPSECVNPHSKRKCLTSLLLSTNAMHNDFKVINKIFVIKAQLAILRRYGISANKSSFKILYGSLENIIRQGIFFPFIFASVRDLIDLK